MDHAIALYHLTQISTRFLDGIERVPNGETSYGVANLGGIRARENRDASAAS